MKIRQYQVDAFAVCVFERNAAAAGSLETGQEDRELLAKGAIAFIEAEIAF
jgi:hypothetical protein